MTDATSATSATSATHLGIKKPAPNCPSSSGDSLQPHGGHGPFRVALGAVAVANLFPGEKEAQGSKAEGSTPSKSTRSV